MPQNFTCFGTAATCRETAQPSPASSPCLLQQRQEVISDSTPAAHSEESFAASSPNSVTSAAAVESHAPTPSTVVWLPPDNDGSIDGTPSASVVARNHLLITPVGDLEHPSQRIFLSEENSNNNNNKLEYRRDSCQSRSTGSTRPDATSFRMPSTGDESATGRRSSGSAVASGRSDQQQAQQYGSKELRLPISKGGLARATVPVIGTCLSDAREVSSERNDAAMNLVDFGAEYFSTYDLQGSDPRLPAAAGSRGDVAAARDGTLKGSSRRSWPLVGAVYRASRGPRCEDSGGRKMMLSEDLKGLEYTEQQQSRREEGGETAIGASRRVRVVEEDEEARGFPAFLLPRRRRHVAGGSFVFNESSGTQVVVKPCIWIAPQFSLEKRISAAWKAVAARTQEEGGGERFVQLSQAQDTGAGSFSPEVYAKQSLCNNKKETDKVGGDIGPSDSAVGPKRGFFWSKSRRRLGSVSKSPRLRSRHKRSSAMHFYVKRFLCVFVYFVVADVSMCALSTMSDLIFQHNPQPKLRDRFHDWILGGTPPSGLAQTVTDCLTGSLFFVTILRHLLFVQLPLNVVIVLRFFFVMSTVYWLRGIAISLTTIPSSVPNCKVRPVHSARDFVENMLLASVFQLPQCTDMIISGHTLSTCLCVATWLFYNNCNKDQADLQRAPFYIFLRWCVKHRRKSLPQQQQRRVDNSASGNESIRRQKIDHVQQNQQILEQYYVHDSDLSTQKYSGRNYTDGVCGKTRDEGDFYEAREKHGTHVALPPALSGHQARSSSLGSDVDADSSSCKTDAVIAPCMLSKQHLPGQTFYKDSVAIVEFADGASVLQHEINEFTTAEGPGSTGRNCVNSRERDSEEYTLAPGSASPVLRSEAVVGAATSVGTRSVATTAAEHVMRPAARAPGKSTAPRTLQITLCVNDTASACSQQGIMYGADFVSPVPFAGAAGEEGISPSAAGGIYTAFSTNAVEDGDERKSSMCSQEMEDFSRGEIILATVSTPEDQDISSTDDEESSREQEKQRFAAHGSTELRGQVEDSLLLTDGKDEEEGAQRDKEVCEAPFKAYRFLRNSATAGQERPLSTCDNMSVGSGEAGISVGAQRSAGKRRETGGLVSIFAPSSCFLTTRASVVAADADGVKAPDDTSGVCQSTPGASSCSSSEEEDGMRALLAPHPSRRRHTEKEESSPFNCCAMPPGLSSFFAAAHEVSSPGPGVNVEEKEDAPAGTFVPVVAPPAGGRGGEESGGYHLSLKNKHPAKDQAQSREEELERMGQQHVDIERTRTAGERGGIVEAQDMAAGAAGKSGILQSCRNCLSSIKRRLTALLLWCCAWNMLGTWCILQAAANIIIIDASFCHYTVDIFFGIFFSFGTFTFYHMIVCLLWAAKKQGNGEYASLTESADEGIPRLPANRYYRRRSSRCRSSSGSSEALSARHSSFTSRCCGAGGLAERQKPSTPRRRRPSLAAAGTRLETPGAGSSCRKARDILRGEDFKERVNDDDGDSDVGPQQGIAGNARASSDGESTAVALSIMREIRDSANCTGAENLAHQLLSSGEEDLPISGTVTGANKPLPFTTTVTTTAAETSSASDRIHEIPLLCNAGGGKTGHGVEEYRNEVQVAAPLDHHFNGVYIQTEVPAASERHFQTSSQHFEKPPEETLITNLEETRTPRLLLWDYQKTPPDKAEERRRRSTDEAASSSRTDSPRAAAGAPVGEKLSRGMGLVVAAARPGASGEFQKKKKISNKITARGGTGRRQRVLQSMERAMQGEPHADAAADIAISILRFPLVRCPAYFIARLEGLELP